MNDIPDDHGAMLPAIFSNYFSVTVDSRGYARIGFAEIADNKITYHQATILSVTDLMGMSNLIAQTIAQAQKQSEASVTQRNMN